jgi:hypothetical protein
MNLSDISPIQWVFLIVGVLIALPAVTPYLTSFLNKRKDTPKDNDGYETYSLTDIVHKWESLEEACRKANLNEASVKLIEVFPLLAKKGNPVDNIMSKYNPNP